MAQALHYPADPAQLHSAFAALQDVFQKIQQKGHVSLEAANALWPQAGYPLLPAFLALAQEYYGVTITPVDYRRPEAARRLINTWAEEKTRGKIRELVSPGILNDLVRLVLTNAIYFKGDWASPFPKDQTSEAPFQVSGTVRVDAPMMAQARPYRYAEHDCLQVLELPYSGGDLAMVILLPRSTDGLETLEASLTAENLERWTRPLQEMEVRVVLPRFTVSRAFRLDETLKTLGMVEAFDMNHANFAGMDGKENWLFIAAVLHQAFVEVNEEGTEAAAATAVIMQARGMPAPVPTFRADHPFIFLIRETRTGSLLFLGRLVDPSARTA
jgi:serpin B